jgi:hypothetical protein
VEDGSHGSVSLCSGRGTTMHAVSRCHKIGMTVPVFIGYFFDAWYRKTLLVLHVSYIRELTRNWIRAISRQLVLGHFGSNKSPSGSA